MCPGTGWQSLRAIRHGAGLSAEGHFQPAGAFHDDQIDLVLLQIFNGVSKPLGLLRFGFGFGHAGNADNEILFGNIDAAIVLGTHHEPSLYSVVLSGNCSVVLMGGYPLFSYFTDVEMPGCVRRRITCLDALVHWF